MQTARADFHGAAAIEQALTELKQRIMAVTGRVARPAEIEAFSDQIETAIAHRQPLTVQMGFCDFQTISGRAELITVVVS